MVSTTSFLSIRRTREEIDCTCTIHDNHRVVVEPTDSPTIAPKSHNTDTAVASHKSLPRHYT